MSNPADECELCKPHDIIFEDEHAYVRMDDFAQGPGHVIAVPKRHVESFFDMNQAEKTSILPLLDITRDDIEEKLKPQGYNIGVNVGEAGGQTRKHVHVHLIPRFTGDAADPRGGVRCVLPRKNGTKPA